MTLDDVLPLCRRHAKNCPEPTLLDAVQWAAEEFCQRSWYYQRTMEINLPKDQQLVDLTGFVQNAEVIAVTDVVVNQLSRPLRWQENWTREPFGQANPVAFSFTPPANLYLMPAPPKLQTALIRLVLQPANKDLPDDVFRNYKRVLAAGALYWVLSMPEEVWTNPGLAELQWRQFAAGIGSAKGKEMTGHMARNLRAQPRSFASGRRHRIR